MSPIEFDPIDLPPDKDKLCTSFPMPTMSGLHVGTAIQKISPGPEVVCQTADIPYATPVPRPTPANLTAVTPPDPTPTRRPDPTRVTPKKLERPPLDWRISGPFPQTLFLGCSVVDFNISLGWGSTEGSTLTVTLVRDPMPTFSVSGASIADKSSRYMGMDFEALKAAAVAVKDTANHYYDSMKPPKAKVEALQAALAALPPNYTETQYRAVMDAHTWTPPAAFTDVNGGPIIPGKLYYEYNQSKKEFEQKYWLGADPGFIGDKDSFYNDDGTIGYYNNFEYAGLKGWGINIIGAPVKFHLDEFQFCGVVTDWKKTTNSGGTQYTVTVQTPVHILRNSQLILGHYAGSVFTKNISVPVIAPASRPEFDGSVPLTTWEQDYQKAYRTAFQSFTREYKNYISGPVNITDTYIGDTAASKYFYDTSWKGNIKKDGNLPNVVNIYGYLESLGPGYFGGSRQNELGVKYNLLIGALSAMLSTHSPGPFNPFGALVGACAEPPFKKPLAPNANGPAPDHNWTDVFHPADSPTVQDKVSVPNPTVAAGNIAGADSPALKTSPATYTTTTYGKTKNIFDFGLIPPVLSTTSSTYKQLYYIDLTELPVMPDLLRYDTNGNPISSVADFIEDICAKGGCEYFWEMLHLTNAQYGTTGTGSFNLLKLRTVSRKTQPPETAVEEYLRGFVGNKTHLEYGKEFNADAKTRVMYLGGKQKRLVQVKNFRLGKSQSVHIYSPITKRFVILDTKEKNKIRIPNVGSTRHPLNLVRGAENTNLNEISVNFFADDPNWRSTNYGGSGGTPGAQGGFQNEEDDENPGVKQAAPSNKGQFDLKTARARASKLSTAESSYMFMGNYFYSSNLVFNKYKDIVTYKTNVDTAETNAEPKKDYKYVLQKRVNSAYVNVTSFTTVPCQLNASAVKNWFKMRTVNYTWKQTQAKPEPSKTYAKSDKDNIGVDYAKNRQNIKTKITTLNRFFPLMHDVICPYFGSYKYLPLDGFGNVYNNAGYINTPRPVWYDMWTNQIVIVFNVADLPRTRVPLSGTYGDSFVVTESELRAALREEAEWKAYLGARLFKPDIVHMFKKALCPLSSYSAPTTDDEPANQAKKSGKDAVPDRQDDPTVVDQAEQIDADGSGKSSVPATTIILDMDNINECDYCQIFMSIFKLPKINLANGSVLHATAPINHKAGLAKAIFDDIRIIHQFFKQIATKYYGREFMVKMPMVRTYVDKNVYIVDDGYSQSLGYGAQNEMRIMEGDGKIYCNYKIHPGGAWEEAGNMIDDQIVIGGWYANIFQNDEGLIEPILGYWSSLGFDYESYFICKLLNAGNGGAVDPEKTKGALFKLGDMIHPPRVCLDGVVGTGNDSTTDNSPVGNVDPKTQPLNHGTDVGEIKP